MQGSVDGGSDGRFGLVYAGDDNETGDIFTINFAGSQWKSVSSVVGSGDRPNIYVNEQDESHLAWCSSDGAAHYSGGEVSQTISTLSCVSLLELAQDSQGTLHLIWYGDAVVDAGGIGQPQSLLYESTRTENGWSEPAIISRTAAPTQPSIAAAETNLHLVWQNTLSANGDIAYASFVPYSCDDSPLDSISQIAYDIARRPEYRPANNLIPYCQNQFHQLVYMSNPDPAYSEQTPTVNGGSDAFAGLAQTVKYELLFTTMWYNADQAGDSPGAVLAESVAALYEKLRANPEQYDSTDIDRKSVATQPRTV